MEQEGDLFKFDESKPLSSEITEEIDYEDYQDSEPIITSDEEQLPIEEADYISQLLKAKGIDKNKIQIYDEEGNLTETNFDDLDNDQKFDLLNSEPQNNLPTDEELEVLNYLRKNKMSLQDFADWQRKLAVEEYKADLQPEVNDFDSYSDEEIVAYDFIQRFGEDMSDEEIDAEIERLKSDPDAFEKRVSLLRNAYKAEAEAQKQLYEEKTQNQIEADNTAFINAYRQAAASLNDIQGINLEDADKTELLSFVLDKDQANRTGFSKAMDNPENVLKMAWALLHGEEAFNATVDYFKKEISKREKSSKPRVVNKTSKTQVKDSFSFV